jgi:hypothetical protein
MKHVLFRYWVRCVDKSSCSDFIKSIFRSSRKGRSVSLDELSRIDGLIDGTIEAVRKLRVWIDVIPGE